MSPRRSSRARTTQPPPVPQLTHSSTSSVSSGLADRNRRSHHKIASSERSVPLRSQSLEDLDLGAKSIARKKQNTEKMTKIGVTNGVEPGEDGDVEDEEVTRCICGNVDFPEVPLSRAGSSKAGPKDNQAPSVANAASKTLDTNEVFYIQCDFCKVWQHSPCVGVSEMPKDDEEYYCEQCRKDLHKTFTNANGERNSRYIPKLKDSSVLSSPDPVTQETKPRSSKETRSSRPSAEALAGKRRSTMNSRDAAYDEAEQLRRAIEESKKEGSITNKSDDQGGSNKRSRSDTEERGDDKKRQRTDSDSPSSSINQTINPNGGITDDAAHEGEGQKMIRGAAARNHRAKELREREEQREKQKADAAGRRKGRAERRRGDDSEPSDECLSRTISHKDIDPTDPPPSQPVPSSPPPPPEHPTPRTSHKKTGRPPARRGRVGRNQYTRDRDPPASAFNGLENSLTRSNSRDGDDAPHTNGLNGPNELGKPSRPKHLNPNRTSLNDMKRRVAGILEFISVTQVEMAADDKGGGRCGHETITNGDDSIARDSPMMRGLVEEIGEKEFASLSSVEMMEVLTRKLMRWQGEFGKHGDK